MSGLFNTPWAVDANGVPVRTWFELDGNDLTQQFDLADPAIAFPIVADPDYYHMDLVPIDNSGGVSDYVHGRMRPSSKTFVGHRGYYPIWGVNQGVSRAVKHLGECSGPEPDHAFWYDFEIPCEMHDYCWDLKRVNTTYGDAFYPGVTTGWCDSAFLNAMNEHCNWRPNWQSLCKGTAEDMYYVVSVYGRSTLGP